MKWITRERPKIDRIACPWLITRRIDREAEFLVVPAGDVRRIATETGAIPYDIPGVELSQSATCAASMHSSRSTNSTARRWRGWP